MTKIFLHIPKCGGTTLTDGSSPGDVRDGVAATNRLACRLLEQVAGLDAARVFYAPYSVESPLQ